MSPVSIALATYNGENYLAAQLKSLVDQADQIAELVVADDGSTDHSLAIVRKFSANAPFPVRIIENATRLGYRANFMQAAAACTGELIAFCDQDDIWRPDKLATVVNAFADPNVLLVFHDARLVDDAGHSISTLFRGRARKIYPPLSMRPWMIIPGLTQTMRRSLLRFTPLHSQSIDPYVPSERMSHDIWCPFWASVLGNIAYLPDPLVDYRQHGANTSGWLQASWSAYLHEQISNAENYAEANAISSRNRLDLLAQARNLVRPDEAARIDAAIAYYEALHVLNESRLGIYRSPSIGGRTRALSGLLRQGAYTRGGLGLDALILDTVIGLPSSRIGRGKTA
jgi:glycosyltransferase involved in cell wall biosynthesis